MGVEPMPNDSKIANGRLHFCCFYVLDLQFRVAMQAEAAAQADTLRDQVRDLNARVRHKNVKNNTNGCSPCIFALQMQGP
jgi:hypothetical protein